MIGDDIKASFEASWKAGCQALDESVHEVYLISTNTYCPVDTGLMKSTAKDELVTDTDTEHKREISYGSEAAHYTKTVHEIYYNHYNPPLAQWKFLEVPARLQEKKLLENVKSAMRDAIDS